MNKDELKKLFSREDFIEELRTVDSVETLQAFLGKHNLKMSIEEINDVMKSNQEMSEEELGEITGGKVISWVKFAWKCFTWNMIEAGDYPSYYRAGGGGGGQGF